MKETFAIILIFVVLSILGAVAAYRVPINLSQGTTKQHITVVYNWASSSPISLEKQVTTPLEGILSTLPGVKKLTSTSDYGNGHITLTFDDNIDIDKKRFEISSLIRQVFRRLPSGVSYPAINTGSFENFKEREPLMILQLNGNQSSGLLRRYIDFHLKSYLLQQYGVSSMEVFGGEQEEISIEYRPSKLQSLGLTEEDVLAALSQTQSREKLGSVTSAVGLRKSVSLSSQLKLVDLEKIPVKRIGGRIITLGNIATVKRQEKAASSYFRINGRNAVQMVIFAELGYNPLEVAEGLKNSITSVSRSLPKGFGIRIEHDQSSYIQEKVYKVITQACIAVALLLLMVSIVFRDWRPFAITIFGLVANTLMSALTLFILNIEIRFNGFAALIISAGFTCGQIWIFYDYYRVHKNRSQIKSLLSAVLVLTTILSVIWMLPENVRGDMTNFSSVLLVTQYLTLCTCFWFVPALMEKFTVNQMVKNLPEPRLHSSIFIYTSFLHAAVKFRRISIGAWTLLFGIPTFLIPSKIEGDSYWKDIFSQIVQNTWYSEHARPYIDKSLGGTLRLFSDYVYDKSFYANDEETALKIDAGMPNHATVEQMDHAMHQIESEFIKYREIDRVVTRIHSGQNGSILIYFKKPYQGGSFPFHVKMKAISLTNDMSGIDWDIYGVGQGYNLNTNENVTPTFGVLLKGYGYDGLETVAIQLRRKLLSNPRIKDVDINRIPGALTQKDLLGYKLDRSNNQWNGNGITDQTLFQIVEKFGTRSQADMYGLFQDNYIGLNIKPHQQTKFDLFSLSAEPLGLMGQPNLKAGEFMNVAREKMQPSIRKENQEYLRQISFEYMGGADFGEKYLNETLKVFKRQLPMGYSAERQKLNILEIESERRYELLALALIMTFILGAVTFESLRQPLTLILSIIFSFIGTFLAFYVTDAGFDQGGYASFFLVASIASLLTLLVINEYNSRDNTKDSPPTSVYSTVIYLSFSRIMYFILALLTTMVPFLYFGPNQPFWYALAVGTTGGMIASLAVLLFLVPALLLNRAPTS